ncbi:MAG TPA: nucleotidyltransferase family protein [Usitatibacteraceae bacterium]|nr:nucleotidyltransferase family protein [Usitatibacteraceae bacterium]
MDALILAGGLGTRLASAVPDRAKPVAEVAGHPFLAFVLDHLARCGRVRRVILCVGHRADTVEAALGARFGRLPIAYSHEDAPLGTGGALRHAIARFRPAAPMLAMNGDTLFTLDLARLLAFHRAHRAGATMALARVPDASRFGTVDVRGGRVTGFAEKGRAGPGWINAGTYVLGRVAAEALAAGPPAFSLERDALPAWCADGLLAGLGSRARFLDIGVPQDYARAAALFGRRPPQRA